MGDSRRLYKLKVVQNPIRARMCGLGDKDRRQISPPPCVRLYVYDAKTKKELDVQHIDISFFVLMVELWSVDQTANLSLVISPNSDPTMNHVKLEKRASSSHPHMSQPKQKTPATYIQPLTLPPATRNLIGSLSTSAFRLHDLKKEYGIWFVLQDLSIRSEGTFRLKFHFLDLSSRDGAGPISNKSAPIIASCFSEPFQVYSAKKFPGVIDSTPLSKCFASQGIKIPVRREQRSREHSSSSSSQAHH